MKNTMEYKGYVGSVELSEEDKVLFLTGLYPTGKKYYYAVNLAAE